MGDGKVEGSKRKRPGRGEALGLGGWGNFSSQAGTYHGLPPCSTELSSRKLLEGLRSPLFMLITSPGLPYCTNSCMARFGGATALTGTLGCPPFRLPSSQKRSLQRHKPLLYLLYCCQDHTTTLGTGSEVGCRPLTAQEGNQRKIWRV